MASFAAVNDERRFAPASARNREPILEVLRRHVQPRADVLEIASGSGEHAVFLAPRLEVTSWQPTDPDASARRSIDAWRAHEGDAARAVRPAIELDVTSDPWPELEVRPTLVLCVNMIHIAPFAACEGLVRGSARALPPGGLLCLYGPYKRDGEHTAPSNAEFDRSLRSRNPEWGVRDLGDVTRVARARGFEPLDVVAMPANNLTVLFRLAGAGAGGE